MRKALRPFAYFAALIPLLLPRAAQAATTISTSTSTPLLTSGTGDLTIASGGSVALTDVTGPAVTLDAPAAVDNEGALSINDDTTANTATNNSTALLVTAASGTITNGASISNLESYAATDTNSDGIVDGAFALGSNRFGLRVAGPFAGDITQTTAGSVTVKGNNSAAVEIDGAVTGNVQLQGALSALGDNSYAFRATAPVDGNLRLLGSASATGAGATAVSVEGNVSGQLQLQGAITNTGYRVTARPADATIALMTPDEMQQGGPAVNITGNIGGGVLFDVPPTASTTNTDVDGDGIPDAQEGTSSISQSGSAPAVQIGPSIGGPITISNVGATSDLAYGVVNKGSITAVGIFDNVPTTGVLVRNANLTGGVSNVGSITTGSFDTTSTSIDLASGATLASLNNSGSVNTNLVINSNFTNPVPTATAYGMLVESGASVPSFNNSGAFAQTVTGDPGDAVAVKDLSNSLHSIVNTGSITALHLSTDNLVTGRNVAFDLSAQTTGTTITQSAPSSSTLPAPTITGDVLFGSGDDTLDVESGSVKGAVNFGAGSDTLTIGDGATVTGAISNGGTLALTVNGALNQSSASGLNVSALNVGATGDIALALPATPSGPLINAGSATFASGSQISILLSQIPSASPYVLINSASAISGSPPVSLTSVPIIFAPTVTELPNSISVSLAQRTASDPVLGLNKNEAAIYQPFFDAAAGASDPTALQSLLGISTAPHLQSALDQLLPNASGAELAYAQTRGEEISSMVFSRYAGATPASREIYAWANEFGYARNRDQTAQGQGFNGFGFGVAGGIDGPMGRSGYKGFGIVLSSDEIHESTGFDKPLVVTSAEVMAHAVQPFGGVVVGGRLGVGYDHFSMKRDIVLTPDLATSPTFTANTSGAWSGAHVSGSLHAAYPGKVGGFTIRPDLGVDTTYMWEGSYSESEGGLVDLAVGSRSGARADASATVAFGHPFKTTEFIYEPSLTLGVRQPLLTSSLDTKAQLGADPAFTLTSDEIKSPAIIGGLALNVEGQIGSFRIEATGEKSSHEIVGVGRAVLRLTF